MFLRLRRAVPFELAHQLAHQLAPGLIHGLVQMLDDVEAVKDHPCLRSLFADVTVMYGFSHVHAYTASELRGSLWSASLRKNQHAACLALRSFPAVQTFSCR